ncbi:hypothetical protein BDZ94DRAFT_1275081 [Collybia nuda]|uniref:Uncharacterized protein n=1 Tax=Collybia nuda TaxID=64659 RepID=A0A9P5XSC0_9AGAR|nr:hypothetical protein BDZ94DRAFT_1275081 [Collybia nuda]
MFAAPRPKGPVQGRVHDHDQGHRQLIMTLASIREVESESESPRLETNIGTRKKLRFLILNRYRWDGPDLQMG